MKKRITKDDYVKANRKASREAEIEMHGHPICHKRVHKSEKVYNRKKIKAAHKELPYLFSTDHLVFIILGKKRCFISSSRLNVYQVTF